MVTPMQILSCNSPQHFIVFLFLSSDQNVRSVPASAILLPNFLAVFVPLFFVFFVSFCCSFRCRAILGLAFLEKFGVISGPG